MARCSKMRLRMFKQRVLTILVLLPAVLLLLLYAPFKAIIAVIAGVTLIGGWEWAKLADLNRSAALFFTLIIAVFMIAAFYCPLLSMSLSLMLWPWLLFAVVTYPRKDCFLNIRWLVCCLGVVLLPAFFISLLSIMQNSRDLLLYLLVVIWVTDSGAYVAGKLVGKHKLIAAVSPGKTIEGVIGGFLCALLVGIVGLYCFQPKPISVWLGLTALTALISVLGDLFISLLKRHVNLKDTGNLFPGHGGVLDRVDSLLAAAPVFAVGLMSITL